MRLTIEIVAAALLVCIATSAASAAGKAGRSADGLSCSFTVAQGASPAARCLRRLKNPAPIACCVYSARAERASFISPRSDSP